MTNFKQGSNPNVIVGSWVQLYTDLMFSWALYKTGKREIAEDLVQDTFLAALQSFEKFEGKSSPKTWLFAILNNKISDYHRKNFCNPTVGWQQESEDAGTSFIDTLFNIDGQWIKEYQPNLWPEEHGNILDDHAFNQVLQLCMEKLPAQWFSAIHLKYIDEKKGEMICQELGISPTNFWQILHRAKLQLRNCLELTWFKN